MTSPAKKRAAPEPAKHKRGDEEITIERRVRLPEAPTQRLTKIDERLLAITRGELEPDDPFGGLIPIYDDDVGNDAHDGWLFIEESPASADEALLSRAVPHVRMSTTDLLSLPVSDRASFFMSQVDGRRTLDELAEICELAELESLEILDELLRLGAIELL